MKLSHRRQFLHLAAGAATLPALSPIARGQTYPTRPVRLVVGFPPGGVGDILARLIGHSLSSRLGQPLVIENRPGAGGNIGTEVVIRAPADGYTFFLANTANAINATLYDKLNFDFIRDAVPVGGIARAPGVLEVNPAVPVRTIPEFITYAKANPGKVNFGSSGNGGLAHVAGELFKMMAGVNLQHVPYRGSAPALTDLLGGQVQAMFDNVPSSIEYIRSGKLRALGVTAATRVDTLPDVPTVAEFVPGYEATGFFGIVAPQKTPRDIVETINKEMNSALGEPNLRERLVELGAVVSVGSPSDFGKLIIDETDKWAKVVKFSGAKPG
jgi:tripartite-type tricarboxylate transporter receptor subunit TctC